MTEETRTTKIKEIVDSVFKMNPSTRKVGKGSKIDLESKLLIDGYFPQIRSNKEEIIFYCTNKSKLSILGYRTLMIALTNQGLYIRKKNGFLHFKLDSIEHIDYPGGGVISVDHKWVADFEPDYLRFLKNTDIEALKDLFKKISNSGLLGSTIDN
jgi:hypothetical protein